MNIFAAQFGESQPEIRARERCNLEFRAVQLMVVSENVYLLTAY